MKKLVITEEQYNYLANKILAEDSSFEPTPQDIYNNMRNTGHGYEEEKPSFQGWKRVRKGNKMNIKNVETGEYLSSTWFDWIGSLVDGYAIVNNIGQGYNIINQQGNLVLSQWHEDIDMNDNGFIVADADGQYIKTYTVDDLNNGNITESVKKSIKENSSFDRYIKNEGDLFDYFYDYIDRHFNEITDNISLKEEFDNMWFVTTDYIDDNVFQISKEEAFRLFQHAFGQVNDANKWQK